MKKNVFFYSVILLMAISFVAIAQEQKDSAAKEAAQKRENPESASSVSEKIETPKELQGERAVFYIVNDKPVSREEYLEYQQKMMERSVNTK
jgi:hypothetical protein